MLYILIRGVIRLITIKNINENEFKTSNHITEFYKKPQKSILDSGFWLQIVSFCMVVVLTIAGVSNHISANELPPIIPSDDYTYQNSIRISHPAGKVFDTDIICYDYNKNIARIYAYAVQDGQGFFIKQWFEADSKEFIIAWSDEYEYEQLSEENISYEYYRFKKDNHIKFHLMYENNYIFININYSEDIDSSMILSEKSLFEYCKALFEK